MRRSGGELSDPREKPFAGVRHLPDMPLRRVLVARGRYRDGRALYARRRK
jgi:hypothetical protein